MDAFSYLSVLLSVILGLAVTQVLQGARSLVLTRKAVRFYLPVVIWAVTAVLVAVQSWWASFALRNEADWTFADFLAVIVHSISIYLVAALVLPDISEGREVDLRWHYQAHRGWFFGALLGTTVLSLVKEIVLHDHLPSAHNLGFHIAFIILALPPLLTGRERVQQIVAPAGLVLALAYVATLFQRL
jgi:hypothetical protein